MTPQLEDSDWVDLSDSELRVRLSQRGVEDDVATVWSHQRELFSNAIRHWLSR